MKPIDLAIALAEGNKNGIYMWNSTFQRATLMAYASLFSAASTEAHYDLYVGGKLAGRITNITKLGANAIITYQDDKGKSYTGEYNFASLTPAKLI